MEILTMRNKEVDRLKAIQQVLEKKLSWRAASEQLGLSMRQIGNLCMRVRAEGNRGIIHKLRGRASNHQLAPKRLEKALALVEKRYADFGPTLANEKLAEKHRIKLSTSVLRQGMIGAGLWKPKRGGGKHGAWRARRGCVGELIQLDGSPHDWFEGRCAPCFLISYVDDATSQWMYGEFVEAEDTWTLLRTTEQYLRSYGRPIAFYVDKDSIYKVNREARIEEELREEAPATQFTRAMTELGIRVICAHSPQAKGRVERKFGTLQDRLVKELRLEGIGQIPEANRFLKEKYRKAHNERFAVAPARPEDAHRGLLRTQCLEEILSIRSPRVVANDYTIRYQNQRYQILPEQPVRVRPRDPVMVEVRLDASCHVRCKERYLNIVAIDERPTATVSPKGARVGKVYKPALDHPWRQPRNKTGTVKSAGADPMRP